MTPAGHSAGAPLGGAPATRRRAPEGPDRARPSAWRGRAGSFLGLVVAVLMLAGCSGFATGDTGVGPQGNPTPGGKGLRDFKPPPGFTTERAWTLRMTGRSYSLAPQAGLWLEMASREGPAPKPKKGEQTGPVPIVLFARSLVDGAVVWSSVPLPLLTDPVNVRVAVVDTPQGEFAVVLRIGTDLGGGMVRDQRVLTVESYRVGSAGTEVRPVHTVRRDIPAETTDLDAVAAVGDGGVILPAKVGANRLTSATLWDPVTDRETPLSGSVTDGYPLLPTAAGVLSARAVPVKNADTCAATEFTCPRTFGIAGKWQVDELRYGMPVAVTRTAIVFAWWAYEEDKPKTRARFTAYDLQTGERIASVDCNRRFSDNTFEVLRTGTVASPNERFIAVDSVGFDVSARTATCWSGDRQTKAVLIRAVSDAGVAYGWTDEAASSSPLTLRIATSEHPQVMENGSRVPRSITGGFAVFLRTTKTKDDRTEVDVVVCPKV